MQILGVSRQVKRALLLKTGQTTQYGGYLDDGYYQKGIAKAYSVLTTGQYSGTTNIVLNGKTDSHSNNCVLDLNTGLMWSRYASASVGPGSDGKLPFTTNVNGEGIFSYCAAANVAGLAGYTDWRVPNPLEGVSIINNSSPGMDIVIWPITFSTCWSSGVPHILSTVGNYFSPIAGVYGGTGAKTVNYLCALVRGG